MIANYSETERDLYLPKGTWISYHTGEFYKSTGREIREIKIFLLTKNDIFRLPLLVKSSQCQPYRLMIRP